MGLHDESHSVLRRAWNRPRARAVAIVSSTVLCAAWPTDQCRAAPDDSTIRFRVIDGTLCARCAVHCADRSVPANVMIDLGSRVPLLVHERTAKLLRVGADQPVELRFDDLVLSDIAAIATGLPILEELSREHSSELGELPAVAIVGLPAFQGARLQVDVADGTLRLLPEADAVRAVALDGGVPSARPEGSAESACTLTFNEEGAGYWLSALAPGGFALRARLATAQYDTLIDSTAADLAGAPAGDLDELRLGSLNIARYVAFRPTDLSGAAQPRADLVLGTNLLTFFRLTVDPANRLVTFEPTREPDFPDEERRYFVAMVGADAAAIEAFLEDHPTSRLAGDAAEQLLALRLDQYPPDREALRRAIRARARSVRPERRAGSMVELADQLLEAERDTKYDLAADALAVGLEHASLDVNAKAAHEIHARLGLIALRRDDLKEARRQLLSAAFGLPKDPRVNLWMGELYERSSKKSRAWSRYVQAAITDDAPPDALRGLDRLNRDPDFRGSFSMADAQELLEGRVLEFHPPERLTPNDAAHVQLVELFSCIDHPLTLAAELGFQGLTEFYSGADVTYVQYHLSVPETDPLVSDVSISRAAFYGVEGTPVAVFDGVRADDGGGTDRDIGRVYQAYKAASLAGSVEPTEWRLAGHASVADGHIQGEIELTGPEAASDVRLHLLLCENAVMAPGANGVLLHHRVARWGISPPDGLSVPAAAGRRSFVVQADAGDVAGALDKAIRRVEDERNIEFLTRPTYVDANACTIVGFLQDIRTRGVLAAGSVKVAPGEGPR